MAVPTRTFSLVASSMKPAGATTGILALGHLLRRGDAQRAAKVVDVAVREDDARHRLVAQVLARERQRRGGTLACGERVDDDEAGLAFDQRHVGDVEAAQLPDAVGDLEQPDLRIQHRVPPQARVDGGWRLAVDELVGIEVDQHRRAIGRQDLALWARDQTTPGVLEILWVVELEFGRHLLVGLQRGRHGVTGGAADAGVLAASGQQRQQRGKDQSLQWVQVRLQGPRTPGVSASALAHDMASTMAKRSLCIVLPPDTLFVGPAATTLPWFSTAAKLSVGSAFAPPGSRLGAVTLSRTGTVAPPRRSVQRR